MAKSKAAIQAVTDKHVWVYDIEQFANFFLARFKEIHTGQRRGFIIYHDYRDQKLSINQVVGLIKFLEQEVKTLIGYNSHDYDDLMLKHIITNKVIFSTAKVAEIVQSTKALSDRIINQQYVEKTTGKKDKYLSGLKSTKKFGSLDLIKLFNTIDRVGLKQLAINLKWHNIIDLPFHPDHIVVYEEIEVITFYCDNDVDITDEFRRYKEADLRFRKDLSRLYGINVMNSNDTNISKAVIRKFYCEETSKKFDEFKDLRTYPSKSLPLRTCISKKIRFSTQKYMHLLNVIRNKTVDITMTQKQRGSKEKEFEYVLKTKYISHTIGLGGIHSNNDPEELRENKEYVYIDADVTSFYPRLIVNEKLFPKHLGQEFTSIYEKNILDLRVKAKKDMQKGIDVESNKVIELALKNAANHTFGLTKSIYSWMYDPYVTTYITISGQLFLCMLMERLEELTDCVVVYSNTDGITTRVPRKSIDDYYRICAQWEQATGFSLDYVNYKRMVLYSISDYLMITSDKKKEFKEKGFFTTVKLINKGYQYPVISKALYNYYINNTPVDKFIKSQTDVYDFLKAERTSEKKYDIYFWPRKEGKPVKLQKSNRWIVTKGHPNEGIMVKYSKNRLNKQNKPAQTKMQKDRYMVVANNMAGYQDITKVHVDYEFYINECIKIIKLIKIFDGTNHFRMTQGALF